jgi:hypothetical protein
MCASKAEVEVRKQELVELDRARFESKSLQEKKVEIVKYMNKLDALAQAKQYHHGWVKIRLEAKYPNIREILAT